MGDPIWEATKHLFTKGAPVGNGDSKPRPGTNGNAARSKIWLPPNIRGEEYDGPTEETDPNKKQGEPQKPLFKFYTGRELAALDIRTEWWISYFLAKGQPAVVGGPRKALKTSTLIDLALSLSTGEDFLGRFPIKQTGTVAFMSGESGEATIVETARRVGAAKGIDPFGASVRWCFSLPQLADVQHLAALQDEIRSMKADVIIIDPLYLSLLSAAGTSGQQASNLYVMGPLLLAAARTCLEVGATPILAHHFKTTRTNPNEPPQLEDLAFAGIQEFARQWILLGRRETFVPGTGQHRLWLSVGGSAGHSGLWHLNIDEGSLGNDSIGRQWDVQVLQFAEGKEQEQGKRESERKIKTKQDEEKDDGDILVFLDQLISEGHPVTKQKIIDGTGKSRMRVNKAIYRLLHGKIIEETKIVIETANGASRDGTGYKRVDDDL